MNNCTYIKIVYNHEKMKSLIDTKTLTFNDDFSAASACIGYFFFIFGFVYTMFIFDNHLVF